MIAALLLSLVAIFVFSGSADAAVFGTDERTRLDTHDAALEQKIGTLTATDNGSFCTAFCVAPDMIATASHCLFGTAATPGPKLRALRFKLAESTLFDAGTAIAGRASANQSQHVIAGTRRLAGSPPIGAAEDWAVGQLDQPGCKAGGLAMTTKSSAEIMQAAARGEIYQVAVHADLSDAKLHRGGPCVLDNQLHTISQSAISRDFLAPDSILFHTCDTGGGSSGSPLLINTPVGPEVVALNVGTYVRARSVPTARTSSPDAERGVPIANTAIAIPEIATAIAELTDRQPLTSRAAIRRVQQLLSTAGLYRGVISGSVSTALITAVKQFEEQQGAPVSGSLDQHLVTDLERWHQNRAPQIMSLVPIRDATSRRQP